jgi:hypothetical protein
MRVPSRESDQAKARMRGLYMWNFVAISFVANCDLGGVIQRLFSSSIAVK